MKEQETIFLTVKDHSVSKETFQLVLNTDLEMLETKPQPSEDALPAYYQSEDYISHTDAKRSLFEKLYHLIKTYALVKKVKLIYSFKTKEKELLDIGAGTGDFLKQAQSMGWSVCGVEPNASAIENAKKKGIDLYSTLEVLPQKKYDVITLWHVLEHLPNLDEQIAKITYLLKPEGVIVIAVPNYNSYDANYYKEFWAAYDVPRHLWHFSKTSINKLFSKHAFRLVDVRPLIFDSFYVSLLSEKYKTGKMNFISAFYVGLRSNVKAMRSKNYSSLIYVLKK
ncbi:methyltransferase [Neptunitalea chrysea]|uniref:Methyltransferase n=1 Tax=Neptunitalea chrysea TaxID=1647581 RepID=A0A9W6B5I6_9FLAO|nr:class I SAM-dependent methyltransferase [Neptunitalea chrysea]GLB52916.1 methyltransferase [Neptunitalea chrysea]